MAMGIALWVLNILSSPKYRLRSCLMVVLCLTVMQFANSAGAFLVLIMLTVVVLTTTFLKKLNFTQAFIFFILMLSSFGTTSILLIANLENFLSFLDKDITLTGRIPLWLSLIHISEPTRPY